MIVVRKDIISDEEKRMSCSQEGEIQIHVVEDLLALKVEEP